MVLYPRLAKWLSIFIVFRKKFQFQFTGESSVILKENWKSWKLGINVSWQRYFQKQSLHWIFHSTSVCKWAINNRQVNNRKPHQLVLFHLVSSVLICHLLSVNGSHPFVRSTSLEINWISFRSERAICWPLNGLPFFHSHRHSETTHSSNYSKPVSPLWNPDEVIYTARTRVELHIFIGDLFASL